MIAQVYQHLGHSIVMLLLLCGSAFFSASETALFNLTRRQIKQLRTSGHRVHKLTAHLLQKPGHLLNCLLLANITVNVLYFASSSVLVLRIGQSWGVAAATGTAAATFVALVVFGEIVPKSVTYADSRSLAIAVTVPVFLAMQVLGPVALVFRVVILEPILRLLFGGARSPEMITLAEFRSLVNLSRQRGLITASQNKLIGEVVELGLLKVRHVMQPRVDMVACDVIEPPAVVRERMQKRRLTRMPVYVKKLDNIVGTIHLRQLLLKPEASIDRLVQPVHFVPEQKTVESLLDFFRRTGTDMAVVVDEYGGIAGAVRPEDIAEELFGRMEHVSDIEPMMQLGPFEYRLAGDLAVHDWADVFGVDIEETRSSTIGGLVTTLLGKIPREGDIAHLGNLKFTVDRMNRHRIETVILSFEPIKSDG
ncbi:MAG: HlyC/CorC family transporter [Phycisphaerae bacterium]|nr:HlyC/CorC family transporter [Phycisphaerae bacterium]